MKKFGRITAELWTDGEKTKDLDMRVCTEDDHTKFHTPHDDQVDRIKAHRDANQFLCPVDDEIEIYGTHFSDKASTVKINFRPCDDRAKKVKGEVKCENKASRELNLQGKMIIILLNRQELELTPQHDVVVKKHTQLEEIPFTRDQSSSSLTRIMYLRE